MKFSLSNHFLEKCSLIFLTVINCVVLITLIWKFFYGLDLSDESFYILGYKFYDHTPDLYGSYFHMIFQRFVSGDDITLLDIRFYRLGLNLLSVFFLFMGTIRFFNIKTGKRKILILNLLILGSFLGYINGPLSISYNSMSGSLFNMIIGLWMLIGFYNKNKYLASILTIALGFLVSVLFFVKITNVLLVALILVVSVFQYIKRYSIFEIVKKLTFSCIWGCVGLLLGMVFISEGFDTLIPFFTDYMNNRINLASNNPNYNILKLFKNYFFNFLKSTYDIKVGLFALTLVLIGIYKGYIAKWYTNVDLFYKIYLIISLIAITIFNDYWLGGIARGSVLFNVYMYLVVGYSLKLLLDKNYSSFFYVSVLAGIALIGVFGTNNSITFSVMIYGPFILLMIIHLLDNEISKRFSIITYSCIALIAALQILTGVLCFPYRQQAIIDSVDDFEEIVDSKFFKGAKLHKNILELRKELSFLKQEKPKYVFTYCSELGLTLLLENKIPYSLRWLDSQVPGGICSVVKRSAIKKDDIIFIIPESEPIPVEVLVCLEDIGVSFHEDYKCVKKVNYYNYRKKVQTVLGVFIPENK